MKNKVIYFYSLKKRGRASHTPFITNQSNKPISTNPNLGNKSKKYMLMRKRLFLNIFLFSIFS
jgi:hypothetical protein